MFFTSYFISIEKIKKYTGPLSTAIVIVSFFYLGKTLYQYGIKFDISLLDLKFWLILLALVSVYFISIIILSLSWYRMLKALKNKITFLQCLHIMAKTQFAKYIPGNVFHYAGRHVLGARAGVPHMDLVTTVLLETVWYAFTAILLGSGCLIFYSYSLLLKNTNFFVLAAIFLLVPFFIYAFFSLEKIKKVSNLSKISLPDFVRLSFSTISLYLIALFLYSILFWSLSQQIARQELPFLLLAGVFCLSWLIGFITPGAPAGIGVREAVMVASLANVMEKPTVLSLAIAFRLATTVGETLLFTSTLLVPPKYRLDFKEDEKGAPNS